MLQVDDSLVASYPLVIENKCIVLLQVTLRYNRQERKANVGAGTATATEPTREHKQYATQGPTTYLCT